MIALALIALALVILAAAALAVAIASDTGILDALPGAEIGGGRS